MDSLPDKIIFIMTWLWHDNDEPYHATKEKGSCVFILGEDPYNFLAFTLTWRCVSFLFLDFYTCRKCLESRTCLQKKLRIRVGSQPAVDRLVIFLHCDGFLDHLCYDQNLSVSFVLDKLYYIQGSIITGTSKNIDIIYYYSKNIHMTHIHKYIKMYMYTQVFASEIIFYKYFSSKIFV